MTKVYCEDCKYYNRYKHIIGSIGNGVCMATEEERVIYSSTPISNKPFKTFTYDGCFEKNEHNDCSDFKKKSWIYKIALDKL